MPFKPFDPEAGVRIHRDRLPHWRQWGVTYFVTARLADSIPREIAGQWLQERDDWLRTRGIESIAGLEQADDATRQAYHECFTRRFHELIDECRGACQLARPECAAPLVERLVTGHERDYALGAWCVMPNHIHVLVEPAEGTTLGKIVRSWKGGSAREINRILGRSGKLWQAESFDHIVRSSEQREHFRRYIADNPRMASLEAGFVLGEGREISARAK